MAVYNPLGSTVRNDGGKILGGGDNTSARWGVMTLRNVIDNTFKTGTDLNYTFTKKAVSGGVYGNQVAGNYVARLVNVSLAGVANNTFRIPASSTFLIPYNKYISYNRLNITGWNPMTGAATYGVNRGVATPNRDTAGNAVAAGEPFPTRAVPGELVYRTGAANPVLADYQPITG